MLRFIFFCSIIFFFNFIFSQSNIRLNLGNEILSDAFLDIKNTLLDHKQRLSSKYGLSNLAIFGSYARNQQTEESDLDILVEFNRPIGLEFIDLADELEHILKLKVDLVSKKGLKERHLKSIEK